MLSKTYPLSQVYLTKESLALHLSEASVTLEQCKSSKTRFFILSLNRFNLLRALLREQDCWILGEDVNLGVESCFLSKNQKDLFFFQKKIKIYCNYLIRNGEQAPNSPHLSKQNGKILKHI